MGNSSWRSLYQGRLRFGWASLPGGRFLASECGHGQQGAFSLLQDLLCGASSQRVNESVVTLRGHDDQVRVLGFARAENVFHHVPFPGRMLHHPS